MPRRLIVLFSLYLVLSLAVARADDARWRTWLKYGLHFALIDSNGDTHRELDLPIPVDQSLGQAVIISPDGRRIAYITHLSYDVTFLNVYDTADHRVTMTHTIMGEFWATSQFSGSLLFSDSGGALAFGYGIYHREPLEIEWHILILNPANGEVIYHMEKADPAMLEAMGTHARLSFLAPFIRQYTGHTVTFTLELLETEGNPRSFIWDTASGDVMPDVVFPNLLGNTFVPTGEVILPYGDSRFPGALWGETDIPLANTLHVYDPLIHGRYPFYATADMRPIDAIFVQNGERVLMRAGSDDSWHLLERDGSDVGTWTLPDNMRPSNMIGTPDGFLYVTRFNLRDGLTEALIPAVFEVNTRDDTLDFGRAVWSMNTREFQSGFEQPQHASLNILWLHSDLPIGPFLPWSQLAEPVYAPSPITPNVTISPTPLPPPEPIFQVGDEVTVQTIDGEILNLRAEPTRESEIIVYIKDNTHLFLLEGPLAAEGYNWWRVLTPDGLEGWVVENDGEVQTLVPL